MKTTIKNTIGALLCCIAGLTGWNVQGETIINWDGGTDGQNYIQGTGARSVSMRAPTSGMDINYAGDPGITDRQSILAFSTTPLSPSDSKYPNGVDTSLYSTTFYGAIESILVDKPGGSAFNGASVRDADGLGAHLNFNTSTGMTAPGGILTSVVLFKKDDFLGGLGSDPLTLTSMSINIAVNSNMRGRWLVQNGSDYYLSSDIFSATASLADFTTTTWSLYDLAGATWGGPTLNYQPTVFDTVNFNNLQGVGFYLETWDGTDQILTGAGTMRITDFMVTAVIPEPATVTLFGGGMLILLMLGRNRRQRS